MFRDIHLVMNNSLKCSPEEESLVIKVLLAATSVMGNIF